MDMASISIAENCARFDTISSTAVECNFIDKQLANIEQLSTSLRDEHIVNLIANARDIEHILDSDKTRKNEYQLIFTNLSDFEVILSVPDKLAQLVDNADSVDNAIRLLDFAQDLNENHGKQNPVIQNIFESAFKYQDHLALNLCNRLFDLKESSKNELQTLIIQLVRCGSYSIRDLKLLFLQARDHWFNTECEAKFTSFYDSIHFFCIGIPQIFAEYKHVFDNNVILTDMKRTLRSYNKDISDADGTIINGWLLLKTSTFILNLELNFKSLETSQSLTPSLLSDTIENCHKLTNWLSSIGFDFSSQLQPIFSAIVLEKVKSNIHTTTERFEVDFTRLIAKSIESLLLPLDDEILRISNMCPNEQIPKSIEHYPIFKIYYLHIINSLRWIQATKSMLSPINLCLGVYASLNASLTRIMKALSVVLNMDNNSNHPILSKIAVSFLTEVLPFIANYCELFFPERVILSAIGMTRTEFKNLCLNEPDKVKNFRLDMRQIGQPIRATMPALMQAIES